MSVAERYRLFARTYDWGPDRVGSLTLCQQLMYLSGDGKTDGSGGTACGSLAEARALSAAIKGSKQ